MKRVLAPLALALAAPLIAPAMSAQAQAPAAAARIPTVTVVLKDRKFQPQVIRLRRDQLTRIVLVNWNMMPRADLELAGDAAILEASLTGLSKVACTTS